MNIRILIRHSPPPWPRALARIDCRVETAEELIASGKRINRPSDDPSECDSAAFAHFAGGTSSSFTKRRTVRTVC